MTVFTGFSVVQILEADHRDIEDLFDRFNTTPQTDRGDFFYDLADELIRHEVAEEEVVYPVLRRQVNGGDSEARVRIAEQAGSERLLSEMESMDMSSRRFEESLIMLRSAVLRHVELEEYGAFTLLLGGETNETLVDLGAHYLQAKSAASGIPVYGTADIPGYKRVVPVLTYVEQVREVVRHAA
jgi:hypothetical protein